LIFEFFPKIRRENSSFFNLTRTAVTSHEDLCTFMIMSCRILLRMRNVSDKFVEKIKIHILGSIRFFPKILPFFEIMWKNMVDPERPDMTI